MTVTQLEITSRKPAFGGESFGDVGPYELLRCIAHYAVDPNDADSRLITDMALAARSADGKVHFTGDVEILRPVNAKPGSSLLVDFVNRGNRTTWGLNNVGGGEGPAPGEPQPELAAGNGFLMRNGFTLAFCGWETPVPAGRIGLHPPEAFDANGRQLTGKAYQIYEPARLVYEIVLADARYSAAEALPTADLDDPNAMLIERDWSEGESYVIPRDQWHFARWVDGRPQPDAKYVCLPAGFQPGKAYEIIYNTIGAPVIGIGFLALRDCPAFLRYASAADGNPCAGNIERVMGFGTSQSGRTLREFLYLGLNLDEDGRVIYDGMLPHTASSRFGEFNLRFGQPSSNNLRNVGNALALAYNEERDPLTGQTDGLLRRLEAKGAVPKIVATNSAVEYWWSGGSLTHAAYDGRSDLALPDNVRIYLLSGAKHGAGSLPLTDTAGGVRQHHWSNTLDYRPAQRAALLNLQAWVRDGIEPPASLMPRLSDGTAVSRESLRPEMTSIPGLGFLAALPMRRRLDYGEEMARGVPDYPPGEGEPFATLVSAVDTDGNELAGIRLPDIRVPLATHMGWTMRQPESGGAGYVVPLQGAVVPFPRSREEQQRLGDPRPSIEERYASKDDYLAQVRAAAEEMVAGRLVLSEDVDGIVNGASARWDAFQAAPSLVPGAAS